MAVKKNKYGQYMTPEIVADFMVSLATCKPDGAVMEPSSGEGVFIEALLKKGFKNIEAYEIDPSIIKHKELVACESFVTAKIAKKFDLIIGNPPYIRWKNLEHELKSELSINSTWNKYCNSLCDYAYIFIIKSIESLKDGGQLIFITPEYWLNTTHSMNLRNYMLENGSFEEIYHFNETPIFEKASLSTIVFNYRKSKNNKNIKISKYYSSRKLTAEILNNLKSRSQKVDAISFDITQFEKQKKWLLAPSEISRELRLFESKCSKDVNADFFDTDYYKINDVCDIGNGMVSGLDKAFQINPDQLNEEEKKYLIKVIKAKDLNPYIYEKITNYFMIDAEINDEKSFRKKLPNIYKHIIKFRKLLDSRYQYNRHINYWEWVFPRNFSMFNETQYKIFVPSKDRISNRNYFRFALVGPQIFPTQDVTAIVKKQNTRESIYYILTFLNSNYVFDWLRYNGIVKGNIVEFSEKPISEIPFRKINFNNSEELKIHDNISKLAQNYINKPNKNILIKINSELDKLFI